MADATSTPYSTVRPFMPAALPQWLNAEDAERLQAYKTYEDIYWGNPDAFKLMQRGSDDKPIYVPSGRVVVDTMNRYAGKGLQFMVDPEFGDANQQAEAMKAFKLLFVRERFESQYAAAKRFGLIRGDWVWQITANPDKPQGSRITLRSIDPGSYFPIFDDDDINRMLGVDLVEQWVVGDKTYIKRQRYLKSEHPEHPSGSEMPGGPVSYQLDILEVKDWQTKPVYKSREVPPVLLPASITHPPVYHIRNFEEPQNPFGSSEMRGLERLIAAVNQSITDEELALALAGLGVYVTDADAPTNEQGEEVPWYITPGTVVEIASDRKFDRVSGVSSVTPYQDHLRYLHDWIGRTSGASDVAQGVVDVTVAESGVALALRMAPIINSAEEKDLSIKEVHNQMFYDLKNWLLEYEGVNLGDVQPMSVMGPKLPIDKAARFKELMEMYTATPPLITGGYFRDAMRELGWVIDVTGADIINEQLAFQEAADAYQQRLGAEAGDQGGEGDQTDPQDGEADL